MYFVRKRFHGHEAGTACWRGAPPARWPSVSPAACASRGSSCDAPRAAEPQTRALEPSARVLPNVYTLQLDQLNHSGLHNKVSKAQGQVGAAAATAFLAATSADADAAKRSDRFEPAATDKCLLPTAVMLPCCHAIFTLPAAASASADDFADAADETTADTMPPRRALALTIARDTHANTSLSFSLHPHTTLPPIQPITHMRPHPHPRDIHHPSLVHARSARIRTRIRARQLPMRTPPRTRSAFAHAPNHTYTITPSQHIHRNTAAHAFGDGCLLSLMSPGRLAWRPESRPRGR